MKTEWTFESLKAWAEAAFARHGEVLRLARQEADRVEEHAQEMSDRIASIRIEMMSREEFERRHEDLQKSLDERARVLQDQFDRRAAALEERRIADTSRMEEQLDMLEAWRANITGRAVGLGVVGGIIIAGTTAVITHLAGGG